jgi:crooked neck
MYTIKIVGPLLKVCQAQERQETAFRAPKQGVEDFEELNGYRGRKRKEFEERIRRTRGSM